MPSDNSDPRDSAYSGIGGWLALFCAALLVFQPLFVAVGLGTFYSSHVDVTAHEYPHLVLALTIGAWGEGLVALWGIYVGTLLVRRRPGAVSHTRLYLIVALLWRLIQAVMTMSPDAPPGARPDLISASVKEMLRGLIFFGVWFAYFRMSKRVKATFPER